MSLLIPYYEPQLAPTDSKIQPNTALVTPIQGAGWKRGDIVVQQTVGTATLPPGNGTGTLAGVAGPLASAVTLGTYAVAGAPTQTYWIVVTYAASGGESQASQEFTITCPAGYVPSVTVASAGAPGAATSFNWYASILPGSELKQNAAIVTLGTASNGANPLTNAVGANVGATNLSGNILGLAQTDNLSSFGAYPGGSFVSPQNAFGATSDFPPMTPSELSQLYIVTLYNQPLEISLVQSASLSQALVGTQVGLNWASATGGGTIVTADPSQSNKVATIVGIAQGVPPLLISNATATTGTAQGPGPTGNFGDLGGRVIITFLPAALLNLA